MCLSANMYRFSTHSCDTQQITHAQGATYMAAVVLAVSICVYFTPHMWNRPARRANVDVQGRVQMQAAQNGGFVTVNNHTMGGDPVPGIQKVLHIVYTHNGEMVRT